MSESIASVYRPDCACLDDVTAVRHEPAYWVCRRPPVEVLGALLIEFTGVYLDHKNVAQVELPGRRTNHKLPASVQSWPPRQLDALLAVILQMELDGRSPAFIEAAINELTNPEPLREAA